MYIIPDFPKDKNRFQKKCRLNVGQILTKTNSKKLKFAKKKLKTVQASDKYFL